MVEMSRSFTLPPVIQRFGIRCGGNNNDASSISEVIVGGESTSPGEESRSGNHHHRRPSSSFYGYGGGATAGVGGTERVKSFVNGIVSPFTACLQPSFTNCVSRCTVPATSCVSGCGPTDSALFEKQPAVVAVSPHVTDRHIPYRDSRSSPLMDQVQEKYSSHNSHHHPPRHQYQYQHPPPPPYHHGQYPSNTAAESPPRNAIFEDSSSDILAASDNVTSPLSTRSTISSNATFDTSNKSSSKRRTDIEKPRSNDILCGRGGSSNRHLGNIHFRELVAANKSIYVGLTKKQKMLVARKIVDAIHNTTGRFLSKDLDTGLFYDIGLPRSLEKTSQALREKNSNEMPAHLVEGEGIETSVESYHIVVNNDSNQQDAGESPDGGTASSSSSNNDIPAKSTSTKNIETPSLIIPHHLMAVFDPKRSKKNTYEENNHHSTTSPGTHYNTEQQAYDNHHHHSPYTPSPYAYRHSYPPVNHSPATPPNHHHRPSYPPSPATGIEGPPHSQHHYYQNHHPQTPPYGRCGPGPDGRYIYPIEEYQKQQHDNRESYNAEYYRRYYAEHDQAVSRTSPHSRPPPSPTHYNQYPVHQYPSPPRHHGPPPPHHAPYGASPLPYRPYQYGHHQHDQHRHPPPSIPHPANGDTSSSSRIIYRTTSNGYVRGNVDISPERQRELKRQRNVDGHTGHTSEASLSSAVRNSLSLEERVVGRERPQQQQMSNTDEKTNSHHVELISPSMILHTRSRRERIIVDDIVRTHSPSEKKEQDYSTLSGLAALSTAAFLKLDESEDEDKE